MLSDFRFGFRRLARFPGLTSAAVLAPGLAAAFPGVRRAVATHFTFDRGLSMPRSAAASFFP